ncbi:BID domain-containing T4SS effector [Bartonella sp. B35(2025)]
MRKLKAKARAARITETLSPTPSSHHYTYPNSVVPKNKYGIMNLAALEAQCAHDVSKATIRLREEPLPERFNSTYLKYIHKNLFFSVFEWAGCTRDIPFTFADGTSAVMSDMKERSVDVGFVGGDQLQEGLQKLDQILIEKDNLQGLDHKEFAHQAAEIFALLNHLHPFREGNGRTQRLFLENLAKAAGHSLDFSLVPKERMMVASAAASQDGNLGPLCHLFEDISNPQRVLILKEFITNMKDTGGDDINNRIVMVADEGKTCTGIYQGARLEDFMIDMEGTYVVGRKDSLHPEQLRVLRPGDQLTFTAPIEKNLEKNLIPAEKLAALTKEELSSMLMEDACVQLTMEQVRKLSKIVYGNPKILDTKMNLMLTDHSIGDRLSNQISKYPTSISSLVGIDVFCIKSQTRVAAEKNIGLLSCAISNYSRALRYAQKEIFKEHQAEQSRCEKAVTMPSQSLQDLFCLPKAQQRELLSNSPILRKELQSFVNKLHDRLSPNEHRAINSCDYNKLSESIGVSVNKARGIVDIVTKTKETYQQLKIIKVNHSKAIAITG